MNKLFLGLFTLTLSTNLIAEEIVTDLKQLEAASIINLMELESNPPQYLLTYAVPCGGRVAGSLLEVANREATLGVILETPAPNSAQCRALPRANVVSLNPGRVIDVTILNLNEELEYPVDNTERKLDTLTSLEVIHVEEDGMFPYNTYTLTYKEPCYQKAVGVLNNYDSTAKKSTIGVLAYAVQRGGPTCLAMPQINKVQVRVNNFSGIDNTVKVLGLN
jgi:hypothetical protein